MLDVTGLTLGQIALRVAEACGLADYANPNDAADNRARAPSDRHDEDLVKRAVNDAINEMMLAADPASPARVHRWNVLRRILSVTMSPDGTGGVNGDASRYRLPPAIQTSPIGPWRVSGGGLVGTFPCDHGSLGVGQGWNLGHTTTGIPRLAAFEPAATTYGGDGAGSGYVLVVAPKPSAAYVLTGEFQLLHPMLEEPSQRHAFGRLHDATVVAMSIAVLKRGKPTSAADREYWEKRAEQQLARSIAADKLQGPKTLGVMPAADAADGSPAGDDAGVLYNGVVMV